MRITGNPPKKNLDGELLMAGTFPIQGCSGTSVRIKGRGP